MWDEHDAHDYPDPCDDYITDVPTGYSVSHDGRYIGTYERLGRAAAVLYVERAKSQYWPNVWYVNDHGNTTLCVFDGHVLRETEVGYV